VPVPSPGIGDDLAIAFSDALDYAAEHYYHAIQRGTVSRKDLDELAAHRQAVNALSTSGSVSA
jgi:hypothetical protein